MLVNFARTVQQYFPTCNSFDLTYMTYVGLVKQTVVVLLLTVFPLKNETKPSLIMSDSKDSTRLLWTALGAALGGAAVSFVALKYYDQRKELLKHREALHRSRHQPSFASSTAVQRSDSIIFPHNHEEKMRRRIAARVAVEEDNLTPRNSVTVRVPATSANLGPGCTYKQTNADI
jgi:uncharacterized integral membrane protein